MGALSAALAIGEVTRDFHMGNPFGRTLAGESVDDDVQSAASTRRRLIQQVQQRTDVFSVFRRWPIWTQLDRLSNRIVIHVTPHNSPPFYLYVVPQRSGTNGLMSSRIRSLKTPYCSPVFQANVEDILPLVDEIRVIDVGSAFGDCMMWTAALAGCNRTFAVGFDLSRQLSRLAFKSAQHNRFTDCIDVRWGHVSNEFQHTAVRLRNDSGATSPNGTTTLDHELANHEKVHVAKIHTILHEHLVVQGAKRLIQSGGIGIFVIHIGMLQENYASGVSIMDFLESIAGVEYDCTVFNDTAVNSTSFSNITLWQRSNMFEITCRRRDLLQWILA